MKKYLFTLSVFFIFIFSSCSKKDVVNPYSAERKQLENQIDQSNSNDKQINNTNIDFDLTKMSATMIYAEVFNMLIEPEKYENKRLKMKGLFTIYNEGTNDEVYSVIVPDATACCQQGIEFFYNFENRPASGSEIIVTGIFKIHQLSEENGITYNYIQAENVE